MIDDIYTGTMGIINAKINDLQTDHVKLKCVDNLLGEEVTEQCKLGILQSIFIIQEIKSSIIDLKINA